MIAATDAALIQQSLEILAERVGDPSGRIYARLFELHPDYEALFAMDTDGGVRGSMLETGFTCLMGLMAGDGTQRFILEASRMDHVGYGVRDEDFGALFLAMRDVAETVLGADWSAAHAAAWNRLIDDIVAPASQPA